MDYHRGAVVRSLAGRDQGRFLVVTDVSTEFVYLADGKERPLERPKRKNRKHVSATDTILGEEQMRTNKQIRHALRDLFGSGRNV